MLTPVARSSVAGCLVAFAALLIAVAVVHRAVAANAPAGPAAGFGAEVKGLRAKVALDKATCAVGEAITTPHAVRNVSPADVTVWHSGFWPNHQVLVTDADGREPPLTQRGTQTRRAFSPGGERGKNVDVKIAPGTEDATEGRYDLRDLYDLSKPGRYTVQIVYEERQGGWQGRLPSNVVPFEVLARP